MNRILLVEDEPNLAFSLKLNFEAEGYELEHAATGPAAVEAFEKFDDIAVIILDVMLPGMDGFAVARALRSKNERIGIIMLTARASDQDRVRGFEAGVDDYLTKPFHFKELLLRVKRMLARHELLNSGTGHQLKDGPESSVQGSSPDSQAVIKLGGITLDCYKLTLESPAGHVQITALEADLLRELMEQRGKVLSRAWLLERVWGLQGAVETRTVDNFIVRLRRYIEKDLKHARLIKSVRGRGYMLSLDE